MSSDKKFGLLRNLLRGIGLSQDAADQVVDFIVDLLAGEGKGESAAQTAEFPYNLRDHFLSPAELSFYSVLRNAVNGRATLSTKVGLGDLFYVTLGMTPAVSAYTPTKSTASTSIFCCAIRPRCSPSLGSNWMTQPSAGGSAGA